jgi:hypothetical protein
MTSFAAARLAADRITISLLCFATLDATGRLLGLRELPHMLDDLRQVPPVDVLITRHRSPSYSVLHRDAI